MKCVLNPVEIRILGVLIEKQMSTPDYYPMTLNALINACNQKTNRDPVMNLDEAAVEKALDSLRSQRLVWQVKVQGSRALKYEHNIKAIAEFSDSEIAILCELLLRGSQTGGELRSRTVRLTEFPGLSAVEHTLQKLIDHEKGPFAIKLPRAPGQKENRYAHLFSEEDYSQELSPIPEVKDDRIGILEKKVDDLNDELNDLREQFFEFKKQFE
ncbi:MAG: DUF480 domain-containing protein [Desulfobacteraceae bacterium]|nr:DUF480 domain-containing protein [Desulfobacteraceae bacterium]